MFSTSLQMEDSLEYGETAVLWEEWCAGVESFIKYIFVFCLLFF